ncbi:quinol monooxygenase YgiN [Mucilaginibacter sp. UYP25]|uniref:putative quinol monooxygenase n=1 Tax=unclassified Mucilaginibacter TaxID=2617802 RepID=UPI00339111F7
MEPLVLLIKFTANAGNKKEFKRLLMELFEAISKEPTFVNAILHEGVQQPDEILVYETWNETLENFLKVQMVKPYRALYEKALTALNVTRELSVYTPFASWVAEVPNRKLL